MKNVTINYAESWLKEIDPIATGRQLKKLRRKHNITQEQLSELFSDCVSSASRVVISMWENGRRVPSITHVVFLAELYNCSLDELIISYRRSKESGDEDQLVPLKSEYFGVLTSICLRRCSSFLLTGSLCTPSAK